MEKEFLKELQQLLKKYNVEIAATPYEYVMFNIGEDKKCIQKDKLCLEDGSYPEYITASTLNDLI